MKVTLHCAISLSHHQNRKNAVFIQQLDFLYLHNLAFNTGANIFWPHTRELTMNHLRRKWAAFHLTHPAFFGSRARCPQTYSRKTKSKFAQNNTCAAMTCHDACEKGGTGGMDNHKPMTQGLAEGKTSKIGGWARSPHSR